MVKRVLFRWVYRTACVMSGYIGQEIMNALVALVTAAVVVPLFMMLLLIH